MAACCRVRIIFWASVFPFLLTSALGAQDGSADASAGRKLATAVRVDDNAIRVDGRLDDEAWRRAIPITDFIQKEPEEGAPPTEAMEVRVVYDDSAIYIGARMHSLAQPAIQAPLGRRDDVEDQAEYILVSFDSFYDRLTAYGFGVSATGVRIDRYFGRDDETNFDEGFDPVWEAKTHIDETGWTAELWIPFSQLRFNEQADQVWGLNVQRSTPTINEMDYWVPVPRTERGWASRFGDLRGLEGIPPTKRFELRPYVAGASAVNGDRDLGNPFDDGRNVTGRMGLDVKMGLGPNLTLEATVNPDFGQVEADPAEVNLTAFETFFTEKRPFFTEGAPLLNLSQVGNFFYSRRIGARPTAPVSGDYDFVDYPTTSTILASAKLTGRLASGMSVGVLGAVTDEESARASNRGFPDVETIRVAPRTGYGVVRIQQEFGPSASTFGLMATALHRDLDPADPLAGLMARSAFTGAGDSNLRFRGGQYELRSYGGFTYIQGEASAIARVQRSAIHFSQRPDKDYSLFDPTRTSLNGYKAGGIFERTGGRHWLWNVSTDFESPGMETNDIGRVTSADGIRFNSRLRYRETTPGKVLRTYSVGASQNNEWNYGGNRQGGNIRALIDLTFLNFWTSTFSTGPDFRTLDSRLTRGGPLMGTPGGWTTSATLRSRAAAQTVWNGSVTAATDEAGGRTLNLNGGLSFRPGARWQLSATPTYIRQTDSQQYVTTLSGGREETYDRRYVFSYIDRSTLSTQLRMSYTLKPDLNLDVYTEPFAASGRYYDFGELSAPRARLLRVYGTDGTTVSLEPDDSRIVTDGASTFTLDNSDFNVRSFRSNLVVRWEWRPGSTLYLVWQQNRMQSEAFGNRVSFGDLFGSLGAPGSNFFVVKASFWLPIN